VNIGLLVDGDVGFERFDLDAEEILEPLLERDRFRKQQTGIERPVLDHAAQGNRFDPYILIHRVDLETTALQQQIVARASDAASRAADRMIEMDSNNATVHETVARLRLAERRPDAALASI